MSARFARYVLVGACLTLVLAASGCGDSVPDPELGPDTPQPMSLEQRETLPEGYPIEVPSLAGEVTLAETTGDADNGPWHVVMDAPYTSAEVVEWYKETYASRSWRVDREAEETDGYALVFIKGVGAWSSIHVTNTKTGVNIEVWAGVGTTAPNEAVPPSVQDGVDA